MKLNLGCGYDIREGWVNLDIAPLEGVNVIHDLTKLPLPFDDEQFEYIICYDILEHITDYPNLLKELHRITKKDGIVEIKVPHFTYCCAYADPTHKRFFTMDTFNFFIKGHPREYYFDFSFSKIESLHLTFVKDGFLVYINYFIEKIINYFSKSYLFYERTFLSRLFPAANIIVKLKK